MNNKRLLCVLLLASLAMPVQAFDFGFGDIGKTFDTLGKLKDATVDIDEPEEITLGEGVASNLLGAAPLLNDPGLQQYVNQVGRWLALQTERPDLPWHFGVLDDSNINAFATPGGNVFITRGLLQRMQNEAELAGVLAHEIAHVLKRHHLEAIKKNARTGLLADLAVAAADRKGRHRGLSQLAGVGSELYARGLDKDDEFEADRMGVAIAARAGYDPYGLPAVLQVLESVSPENSDFALMFKTHPTPTERLNRIDRVMSIAFAGDRERQSLAGRFFAALGKTAPVNPDSPVVVEQTVPVPVPVIQEHAPQASDLPGSANTSLAVPVNPVAPAQAKQGIAPPLQEQNSEAAWARKQQEEWDQRVRELQAKQSPSSEQPAQAKPDRQTPAAATALVPTQPKAAIVTPPVIKVLSATYGVDVDKAKTGPTRNGTAALAAACNGKANCEYQIDAAIIGDPAPDEAKSYALKWECGDTIWTGFMAAEANGRIITVSCDTP